MAAAYTISFEGASEDASEDGLWRKFVWLLLSIYSILYSLSNILTIESLVGFIYICTLIIYCAFLITLALYTKINRPLKLNPTSRTLFDCLSMLVCICVVYFVDDFRTTTYFLSAWFHVISLLNLFGDLENFDLYDCLDAGLLDAMLVTLKYPDRVPDIVVWVFASLQVIRSYSRWRLGERENTDVDDESRLNLV
ncbi:hypothetical protein ABFS82_03G075200 [Erythranthe guttata]